MAIKFDNIDVLSAKNDGTSLTQINRDGSPIWYALQSVTISGTAQTGKTWTATVSPSAVLSMCTFQWYRSSTSSGTGSAISGATSRTYTTTTSDRGYYIYCVATISETSVKSNVSALIKQVLTSASLSGTAEVGKTLTAALLPSGATATYKWYRDSSVISGATASTYTIVSADKGHKIKVNATGTGNYTGSVTSPQTSVIKGWSTQNSYNASSTLPSSPWVHDGLYAVTYDQPTSSIIFRSENTEGARNSISCYRASFTIPSGATKLRYTLNAKTDGDLNNFMEIYNGERKFGVSLQYRTSGSINVVDVEGHPTLIFGNDARNFHTYMIEIDRANNTLSYYTDSVKKGEASYTSMEATTTRQINIGCLNPFDGCTMYVKSWKIEVFS